MYLFASILEEQPSGGKKKNFQIWKTIAREQLFCKCYRGDLELTIGDHDALKANNL